MYCEYYGIEIEIGQIWKDLDKRSHDRYLKIKGTVTDSAGDGVYVRHCTKDGIEMSKRLTRISLRRLKRNATGYEPVTP